MDGSPLSPNDLAGVDGVAALLELLQEKLRWDLGAEDVEDLDDVTYDWGPEELALKPEHRAKLREIKQLRPFDSDQDWAIFFVSFESEGRLPITVLRRVLRGLTLRGRNASTERSAWDLHDILFISAFGKGVERELAFAHFHGEEGGDLPRLSVLGWDEADTDRRKALTADRLGGLSYEPGEDAAARRERWRAVFQGTKRQTITDSKTLAKELAILAAAIRGRVNELIVAEDEIGHLRRMHAAFQRTLIEGLSADEFADTFAQTVAYGLLTAAFSRSSGALVMQDLVHMVPPTNPFLRGLFERFLHMGGQDRGDLLDYDELGLREVIDLLQAADLEAVRADFGARKPGEDPVIHFYEDFLSAYDKKQKVDAGVFYTPQPVVNFIVRGVDQMLREEFGLPLGLADRATLGEVAARLQGVTVPEGQDPTQPFVRILDPATGTGTFLVEAIELIHGRMTAHWADTGEPNPKAAWQAYVAEHLLPNMSAFELKMAPYAIAHMKVGLKLQDTGYDLAAGERLRVYLTNAMQPARAVEQAEMDFDVEVLAEEAEAANAAKRERHSVVVGNPPYSKKAFNKNAWITGLTEAYKSRVRLEESQIQAMSNDYISFLRYAEKTINDARSGVLGMITGHGFLHGTQPRQMREHLSCTFEDMRFFDLGGSIRRNDGFDSDENVFEIATGVAISVAARKQSVRTGRSVTHRIAGRKAEKLAWFGSANLGSKGTWVPSEPNYWFRVPGRLEQEFEAWTDLPQAFGTGSRTKDKEIRWSTGFSSRQDDFAIHDAPAQLRRAISALAEADKKEHLQQTYSICTTAHWKFGRAKDLAREYLNDNRTDLDWVSYRPFDERVTVVSEMLMGEVRAEVMGHISGHRSPALLSTRAMNDAEYHHAFVVCLPPDKIFLSNKTSGNAYTFPLFLRPTPTEPRRPNVAPAFGRALAARIDLPWIDGLPRASSKGGQVNMDRLAPPDQPDLMDQGAPPDWDGRVDLRQGFGPRDLFDYIYAVLHAPSYRTRYAEFLRSDFPRIPLPGGADPAGLFRAVAAHGRRLTALHLLDVDAASELRAPTIRLAGTGSTQLGRAVDIRWEDGKVRINDERWFETVPEAAWTFRIGGYQPAQKWLKDRAGQASGKKKRDGRVLTDADLLHYRRFVTAMQLTIPEMAAVDATIEAHGGWPDAFAET